LCISKQLSQKLGGDVFVPSEKDKGSQFTTRIDTGIPIDKLKLISNIEPHVSNDEKKLLANNVPLRGHIFLVENNANNQLFIT